MDTNETKLDLTMDKLRRSIKKRKSVGTIQNTLRQLDSDWNGLYPLFNTYLTNMKKISSSEAHELKTKIADKEEEKEDLEEEANAFLLEESFNKSVTVEQNMSKNADHIGNDVAASLEGTLPHVNTTEIKIKKQSQLGILKSGMNAALDVAQRMKDLLMGVRVSKKDSDDFSKMLQDQLVEKWSEETHCKVFLGIEVEEYGEFLKDFQISTGVSEKVMADFRQMKRTDLMKDQLKTFHCEGMDLKGKYGMYASVKHPLVSYYLVCVFLFSV